MKSLREVIHKEHKFIVLKIVLIVAVLYFILLHLGFIGYPKFMVKWFFNANKERFEDIRDRMLENNNPNDRIYTLSTDNTMTKDSDSAFILYVGQYEEISESDGDVDFRLSAFFEGEGAVCGISYKQSGEVSFNEYVNDKVGYHYECISGNWYLRTKLDSDDILKG